LVRKLIVAIALSLLLQATGCHGRVVEYSFHTPTSVPEATVVASATPVTLPASAPTRTVEPPAQATEPLALPTETPLHRPEPIAHTVRPGDTLLGLAMRYHIPMAAIQLRNGMGDSEVIRVGDVLDIPDSAGWENASPFWRVHIVKAGETLSGIARAYNVTTEELRAVNNLADANLIGLGQPLVVPLDAPVVPASPTPAPVRTTVPPAGVPTVTAIPLVPTGTIATPAAAPTPPPDLTGWAYEVARLINQVRAQHGLPPLVYNETLAQVAQAHASDCLQRGWGSHTGSDGSTVKMRMLRAGYDPLYWSECWAHTGSPQSALEMWMNETPPNDPHRRTILSTVLTEVGVGVVKPDWGYYFFADFGTPRH